MKKEDKRLTIVFASSEAVPFSKTGGLADVSGALPSALAENGHDVHLFTPLYGTIDKKRFRLGKRGVKVKVAMSSRIVDGEVVSIRNEGVNVHFISNDSYFNRDGLYQTDSGGDYPDNAERFSFFCKAVLSGIKSLEIKPDVIHVNDWQTALVPVYLKTTHDLDPAFRKTASVMSIHNIGYQGLFDSRQWHLTGLDFSLFNPDLLEFHDQISFLKGGVAFSDILTTVSRTYAEEIQTGEYGCGLDGMLSARSKTLTGIVNGIDTKVWNPTTDKLIPANYSSRNLAGKKICRKTLLEKSGLKDNDEPVMGVISRLVEQKGFDLLAPSIDSLLDRGAKLVLLGSGHEGLEKVFRELAHKRPDKVSVTIGYNDRLAHMIEAGCDMFLMPSRYEPCGLNQLYSLGYGTPPVVRATGGLNDTVVNYDIVSGEGNGFKFHAPSPTDFYWKTVEAISLFSSNKDAWHKMVKNGMREDHSWSNSALEYEGRYRQAIALRGV